MGPELKVSVISSSQRPSCRLPSTYPVPARYRLTGDTVIPGSKSLLSGPLLEGKSNPASFPLNTANSKQWREDAVWSCYALLWRPDSLARSEVEPTDTPK